MKTVGMSKTIFSPDKHYLRGGQGDRIAGTIATGLRPGAILHRLGLDDIPACGTNPEILKAHGFDSASIATFVRDKIQSSCAEQ